MKTYSKGDIVKRTEFYSQKYPNWNVTEAKIVEAKFIKNIKASELDKDNRPIFQSLYGDLKEYPFWSFTIIANKVKYVVCNLGFK